MCYTLTTFKNDKLCFITSYGLLQHYILIDSHPEVSDIMRSIIYASDYRVSPGNWTDNHLSEAVTVIGEINKR